MGGGSKAIRNVSGNSSVLVAIPEHQLTGKWHNSHTLIFIAQCFIILQYISFLSSDVFPGQCARLLVTLTQCDIPWVRGTSRGPGGTRTQRHK